MLLDYGARQSHGGTVGQKAKVKGQKLGQRCQVQGDRYARSSSWCPALCACGLLALILLDSVQQSESLRLSFIGAAAALGIWNATLWIAARRAGRTLSFAVALRKQHYL